MEPLLINPIAYIRNAYSGKFGVPRQSGVVNGVVSTVVFEPQYRNADALRGIEDFDYLWLVWQFSENVREEWSPTVRPPRLGGNRRMGVFATRSPFRPNPIGLSSVRLLKVEWNSPQGPLLYVDGADLVSGTPIYDIKPYIPYTDSHPDARSGFAPTAPAANLTVSDPNNMLSRLPEQLRAPLKSILASDPRPSFHHDPERVYGFEFDKFEVKFIVQDTGTVEIINIF